jgi:hypothetical protein
MMVTACFPEKPPRSRSFTNEYVSKWCTYGGACKCGGLCVAASAEVAGSINKIPSSDCSAACSGTASTLGFGEDPAAATANASGLGPSFSGVVPASAGATFALFFAFTSGVVGTPPASTPFALDGGGGIEGSAAEPYRWTCVSSRRMELLWKLAACEWRGRTRRWMGCHSSGLRGLKRCGYRNGRRGRDMASGPTMVSRPSVKEDMTVVVGRLSEQLPRFT